MKVLASAFCLLFSFTIVISQSLPIDFENGITTENFVDFSGGEAAVINNPQSNPPNTSSKVGQIVRDGGEVWAGSKLILDDNLDFSTLNVITMKVFTTAPTGTTIKLKLETAGGSAERDMVTTASAEWHEINWDFTGVPSDFNELVFMFDFGNIGDGSVNSTFLFDDVQQIFGGTQIDLPVDFQDSNVNYTLIPFEGNDAYLTNDPTDASNIVAQSMKLPGASPSGGTTIGTAAGFATDIPLTLTDSKMTVKVWTPEAGTPVRLKVEDSKDPTHTCETETNTTLAGEWETLEFDFTNQAPGTESLSVGLNNGWTYNKASIFLNFGTDGNSDGGAIYYFDDIKFGELISSTNEISALDMNIYPNPTSDTWNIHSTDQKVTHAKLFNSQGKMIRSFQPNLNEWNINGSDLNAGLYFIEVNTVEGSEIFRVLKL